MFLLKLKNICDGHYIKKKPQINKHCGYILETKSNEK